MKFILFILSIISITSCTKQSDLSKEFNCSSSEIKNTTEYYDFNKNFKIDIPSGWKTDLYYNEFQSELFTADTTKNLSKTFILDVAFNFGELSFDKEFYKKTDSIIATNNLQKIKDGIIKFQTKPTYWYLVKGTKNGFDYHQFNLLVKNSSTTYFTAYSEVYGTQNVNERICKSISILEKIEFLQ